jgi:probable HAF family extracellular repeat protein
MGSGFKGLVAVVLSAASVAAHAIATQWTVVNLTPEGMGIATAVSQNGIVTGCRNTSSNTTQAFVYSNGSRRDLAAPAGSTSCGYAVNNGGVVAGRIDGILTPWGLDGGARGLGVAATPSGINDAGVIVGTMGADYATRRAFMWSDGVVTDLGVQGNAIGINGRNQIAIIDSAGLLYLWESGVVRKLSDTAVTNAYGFNDRGEIVGMSSFGHGPEPFIYDGTVHGLDGGGTWAGAVAINNVGQSLGSGEGVYGYLIENGASARLDVLGANSGSTLLHHSEGKAINDRGWIVGQNGSSDFNAFLMMPKEATTPVSTTPASNPVMRASTRAAPLIRAARLP